jgi:hypothetical protein
MDRDAENPGAKDVMIGFVCVGGAAVLALIIGIVEALI